MDRARLDSWLEKGILGLVSLILVLGPIVYGSTPYYAIVMHQVFIGLALVLWMVRIWVRPEYRILWPPFAWLVAAFVGYAIWQLNNADLRYLTRWDVRLVILYAALFFLIVDNLNRQEWTQYLVCLVIFTGMALGMYALYQFIGRSRYVLTTPQYATYYGRASGTFICPNHLAGYLGMTMPVAFAMALMARFKPVLKVLLGYAGLVMLAGLTVTFSRAGIAAAAIALITLFSILAFNRDWRWPAVAALVLIIGPGLWFATTNSILQRRVASAFASKNTPLDDRMYIWPAAKETWREHFWTGAGPNHYDALFGKFRPPLRQMQAAPVRTHNDYLNTLADWGFIGFGLIAVAWGVFWLSVVRIWRFVKRTNDLGRKQSTRTAVVLGCCVGFVALLLQIIFEFSMHIPALAMLVVTWLAIVSGHWRFATERFWVRPGIAGRLVASAVILWAVGWIGLDGFRFARERYYLAKATGRDVSNDAALEWRKKAFAIDPENGDNAVEIGEILRAKSWTLVGDYRAVGAESIAWLDKGIGLNPYDPHGYIYKGMILHWLDRHDEAWPEFRQAMVLDPNSYYTRALYGWHFVQLGAWGPAAKWFRKSWDIVSDRNGIVKSYWPIVERKVREENLPIELSKPLPEPTDAKDPSDVQ